MSERTHLDFATLAPQDRYKILTGVVVPRPVAWVTTLNADSSVNAAPYSFFNVFGQDPPVVILGLQHRPNGSLKDTTRNIARTGEYVINIATPDAVDSMVASAAAYPPGISETEALELGLIPSRKVAPPALAAASVALECRRTLGLTLSAEREILLGEVIGVSARPGLIDPENCHVDWAGSFPIARLFGPRYAELTEIAPRPIPILKDNDQT